MYVIADNVDIIGCDFTDNHAESWAGAIIVGDKINDNFKETENFNVVNSTFTRNTAKYAGAIDTYGTKNAHIINSSFDDNAATLYGGAMYMTGDKGLIDNCNFTNNRAVNGSAIGYAHKPVGIQDPTKANITNSGMG